MSKLNEARVALVTGGGRGIGREHCLLLAEHGARVVVNDLGAATDGTGADSGPAAELVAEIEAMGGSAAVNGGDVTDFADAKTMVDQAVETFGRLDIVICNAGILRDRMIFSMDEADWDAIMAVHLKGTFAPVRWAAAYWRERAKAGDELDARVITTTSPSGLYGNVGQSNYGAAKAGIAAFTQVIALELARYGVTANCLAPTAVTRLIAPVMGGEENIAPETREALSPRFVAALACWLASPEARGVTGRVFDVRGTRLRIAEGWHGGPTAEHPGDPTELRPVIAELMANARLAANLDGDDEEGPGRPGRTL